MEIDSRLSCESCQITPYIKYRIPVSEGSQVFRNVLWPADAQYQPPSDPHKIVCPRCGGELRRA